MTMRSKLILPILGMLTLNTACLHEALLQNDPGNQDPATQTDDTSTVTEDPTTTDLTTPIDSATGADTTAGTDTSTGTDTTAGTDTSTGTDTTTTPTPVTVSDVQFVMPASFTQAAFRDGKLGSWSLVSATSSTTTASTFDFSVSDADGNYSVAFSIDGLKAVVIYNFNIVDVPAFDMVGSSAASRIVDVSRTPTTGASRILTYTDVDGLNDTLGGVATSPMNMSKDPGDLVSMEFDGPGIPNKMILMRNLTALDTTVNLDFSLAPADLVTRTNTITGTFSTSSATMTLLTKNGTGWGYNLPDANYYLPPLSKLVTGDLLIMESYAELADQTLVSIRNIYDALNATNYTVNINPLVNYSTDFALSVSGVVSGLSKVQDNVDYTHGVYLVLYTQDQDGNTTNGPEANLNVYATTGWLGTDTSLSPTDLSSIAGFTTVSFMPGTNATAVYPSVSFYANGKTFSENLMGVKEVGDVAIDYKNSNALGTFMWP